MERGHPRFVIARNPDPASSLPYLLRLPLGQGLVLKARETWPRATRVYCHPAPDSWPGDAEIVEEVDVRLCRRRGPAIDLVLERRALNRSQFVFTESRGRPVIFWQTQKAARAANPGARVPRRKVLEDFVILVDTRERYPFRFSSRNARVERLSLPAGDYAISVGNEVTAAVERKTLEDFASSLSDGTLAFQIQRLAELSRGAVVVECRYSDLFASST
jgi:ERCC4 domain